MIGVSEWNVAIGAAGHWVTGDAALRTLQKRQMLKAPFQIRRNWEPELVAHIQERVPGFRPPQRQHKTRGPRRFIEPPALIPIFLKIRIFDPIGSDWGL